MKPIIRENKEHEQSDISHNTSQNQINDKPLPQVIVFKGDKDKVTKAEKFLIGISVLLLLLNIVTVIYFVKQTNANEIQANASIEGIKMSKETSQSSDIATNKSLALADSSFVATKQSLKLAQENFRIENRPYLGIKNILLDTFEVGKPYTVTVFYQNFGKTPALEIHGVVAGEMHTTKAYNVFNYNGEEKIIESISVLSPTLENSFILTSPNKMRDVDINTFKTKAGYLYIFGMLIYTDIFTGKDTTTFLNIYSFSAKRFESAGFYNRMK
jgi:cell division protein FtsL